MDSKTQSSSLHRLLSLKKKIDTNLRLEHFVLLFILLALPLILILAKQHTNNLSRAQDKKALASNTINPFADEDFSGALPASKIKPVSDKDPQDALLATTQSSVAKGIGSKPNIIVLMMDDMPPLDGRLWNYLPNIKSLIDQGAEFTNYYGESPLCCPGRAGFLSGQHTFNHGVNRNDARLFDPSETIATELQGVGYYTFIAGKYFNLSDRLTNKFPPGWDNANILAEGAYYNYEMYNNGETKFKATAPEDYSTDVISNKALLSLKRAPATKPIFGLITPFTTHAEGAETNQFPLPAPRHLNDTRCDSVGKWSPPNYNEANVTDKPGYVQARAPLPDATGWDLKAACKSMLAVDEMVKKVKDELIAQNRFDNTMFVITADNGMDYGAHRLALKRTPYATPLPLFIYWPAKFGTSPTKVNNYVANIDLAPTFCIVAGCSMGHYPNGQTKADGASFIAQQTGQLKAALRDVILEDMPTSAPENGLYSWWAVRTTTLSTLGSWHYVENEDGVKELYDLSNGPCYSWNSTKLGDPCELNNLLSPNRVLPSNLTDAVIQSVKKTLALKLVQLKQEKGFAAQTTPPSPTP